MWRLASLAVLLLGGCALLRPAPPSAPPLLPPQAYASSRTLWQQVRVTRNDKTRLFSSLLKIRPDATTLIWFGPMGTRLLDIQWDGASLHTRGPAKLPSALSPAWLMADVQMVYAPMPALQAALAHSGWQVSQAGPHGRTLSRDGDLQVRVTMTSTAQGDEEVTIQHIPWNMTITIRSRPVAAADPPARSGQRAQ